MANAESVFALGLLLSGIQRERPAANRPIAAVHLKDDQRPTGQKEKLSEGALTLVLRTKQVKMFSKFIFLRHSLWPSSKLLSVCFLGLLYFAIASSTATPVLGKQRRISKSVRQDRYAVLVEAAEKGKIKTVRTLIRQGVNVNPKNKGESTALMSAAAAGHLEIVKVLLAAGANPNASTTTRHGEWDSPLISAISSKGDRLKILDALIDGGAHLNPRGEPPVLPPLFQAVGSGDPVMVQELLTRGADANFKFRNEVTPLMVAVSRGAPSMVERLIAAGADVNVKNSFGQTALSLAQDANNEEIVRILQQAGAKP